MTTFLLVISTLWLAYANGANDNAKGVATLIGSRTLSARSALRFAAVATFAGSICTMMFAGSLVRAFGGKGLVPEALIEGTLFPLAVLLAASATVMLAARIGMPVSTTHAMLGGLLGAGFAAAAGQVNTAQLGGSFALPLLFSPIVAMLLTAPLYLIGRRVRRASGLSEDSCLCVGTTEQAISIQSDSASRAATAVVLPQHLSVPTVTTCKADECDRGVSSAVTRVRALGVLDGVHLFSGAALSFARGTNDTAKVIGPLMIAGVLAPSSASVLAGLAMAAGGLLSARKVARTMSEGITTMNEGQGTASNIVASSMVILAGRLGLPVSTTHVSCGSLFGIRLVNGQAKSGAIGSILLAWVTTLPLAAGLSMLVYWVGRSWTGG